MEYFILAIFLLAALAIVVFFTLPRFLERVEYLIIELGADLLCKIEDAVQEWRDLFEKLMNDKE